MAAVLQRVGACCSVLQYVCLHINGEKFENKQEGYTSGFPSSYYDVVRNGIAGKNGGGEE